MTRQRQAALFLVVLVLASLVGACKAGGKPAQPDLVGTKWTLTSLDGRSLIADTEITLYFEETHLGGAMTCNGYGGTRDTGKYTATGDGALTIHQLAVTVQLCSSPEGVMEQEKAYIEALLDAATYKVIDDSLEISDASGKLMLVYARAESGASPSLVGTEWVLTSLDGSGLIEDTRITLDFDKESLGGFAGCNRYGGGRDSGKYSATGDGALTIPQLAVTVQLCSSPKGVMEQEKAYVEALRSAASYRVLDNRLEIADAVGETKLVFVSKEQSAMNPADVLGTRWQLVSLDGDSLAEGSPFSLVFRDEHQIHGQAGSRGYVGGYEASVDDIHVYWLGMMDTAHCRQQDPPTDQEGTYTTILESTEDYRIAEGRLELISVRGEVLVFEPLATEDDARPEGTVWALLAFVETRQIEGLPGPQLMPTAPLSGTKITVTFEDNTASGSAGCNTYSAAYTSDGSALTFQASAATEMACSAPAGVMEQERRYLGFLGDVTAYRIDGSQLWLETGDGRALVFGECDPSTAQGIESPTVGPARAEGSAIPAAGWLTMRPQSAFATRNVRETSP